MSATQLLRILQTLPACVDDENRFDGDFNTGELEESMNRGSRCINPFLCNEEDNEINVWNSRPELESSTFGNDFTNDQEHDQMFRKSPTTCNVNPHLLAKTTGFRTDKHSVEYEMPELVVCYKDKESDFHVKGISIDEGLPDAESISAHKVINHRIIHNSGFYDMIEAKVHDTELPKHQWLSSSTVACCYTDEELDSSKTCEEALSLSTNLYDDNINQHHLQCSNDKLGNAAIVGHSIACGAAYEHPLETESVVNQQDAVSGDHETRYAAGESSFSMAGVISELISCPRPMPSAGGISTRSNSSANSTRSFAFPTLETEYAGSPVRMVKADTKRLKKQRGWRKGLLCCKF